MRKIVIKRILFKSISAICFILFYSVHHVSAVIISMVQYKLDLMESWRYKNLLLKEGLINERGS